MWGGLPPGTKLLRDCPPDLGQTTPHNLFLHPLFIFSPWEAGEGIKLACNIFRGLLGRGTLGLSLAFPFIFLARCRPRASGSCASTLISRSSEAGEAFPLLFLLSPPFTLLPWSCHCARISQVLDGELGIRNKL